MIDVEVKHIAIGLMVAAICALAVFLWKKISATLPNPFRLNEFPGRRESFPTIKHQANKPTTSQQESDLSNFEFFFITLTFGILRIYRSKRPGESAHRKTYREYSENLKKTVDFYMHCTCDFDYTIHSPIASISGQMSGTDPQQVVKKLIRPLMQANKPEVVTIFGNIGCGKSTLISAIINELVFKVHTAQKKYGEIIPVNINVRQTFGPALTEIIEKDIIEDSEIENILRNTLIEQLRLTFKDNHIKVSLNDTTIDEILALAYRKNIHPLIILDELDVVYYEFCKVSPRPNELRQKDFDKFMRIVRFFVSFPEMQVPQGQTKSALFIIALRQTSYYSLFPNNLEGNQANSFNNHTIQLHLNDNKKTKTVITKRLEYKRSQLKCKKNPSPETIATVTETIERFLLQLVEPPNVAIAAL